MPILEMGNCLCRCLMQIRWPWLICTTCCFEGPPARPLGVGLLGSRHVRGTRNSISVSRDEMLRDGCGGGHVKLVRDGVVVLTLGPPHLEPNLMAGGPCSLAEATWFQPSRSIVLKDTFLVGLPMEG